jgi:hypothetical protein
MATIAETLEIDYKMNSMTNAEMRQALLDGATTLPDYAALLNSAAGFITAYDTAVGLATAPTQATAAAVKASNIALSGGAAGPVGAAYTAQAITDGALLQAKDDKNNAISSILNTEIPA